ncbi:MAG: glycine--tRNA ligase [Armatimonadota bacterium]|nr:MAG: glycine--tRNA ligase [Armatimonadota bacterium]
MERIVSLCKRRGFIFPSSEIYGGTGSVWDYGPFGVLLKNNVKAAWWRAVVQERADMVGLDAAILMHPRVWEASGHVKSFTDPLVDCKQCKQRFRADDLAGDRCPACGGELTEARPFNLMFKTFMGPVENDAAVTYLRPETCQGIFANFKNVLVSSRKKPPFGIAQIGKSFRNEITTGNFTFRSREFEQYEIEYFVPPDEADQWFEYWVEERLKWYTAFGVKRDNLRLREHGEDELAHYASRCSDIEYNFPFGWSELEGIANRQDFDLRQHQEHSGRDLAYFDEATKQRYLPHVIEPSGGVDRSVLAFVVDAYEAIEGGRGSAGAEVESVLRLHPRLAPVKAAVLPLVRRDGMPDRARAIYEELKRHWFVEYDEGGSIGRRYRRQDEIGTPFGVTIDSQTLEDDTVTVRDRDTMEQVRVSADRLVEFLRDKLGEC